MDLLLFDRVRLTRAGQRVDCPAEDFLRLPLAVRTAHILTRDVEFFRGENQVEVDRALASLRAVSAELNKPKVVLLSDEPDIDRSVAALEAAGYHVVVVSFLTELVDVLSRFRPSVVVVNSRTAVLDETAIRSFIGRSASREILFLGDSPSGTATAGQLAPGDPDALVRGVADALRRLGLSSEKRI